MMNEFSSSDHTFAICAYKESEYLQECVDSLLAQDAKSRVIICTSTPNEHIERVAQANGLELRLNLAGGAPGIAGDWNFALRAAGTRLVTLAHQDDVYMPGYLSTALELLNKEEKPLIFFSHYAVLANGKVCYNNLRLSVRKALLWPVKVFPKSKFFRRRALSFGNVVCCPSVMYVEPDGLEFTSELRFCLDWKMYEELSNLQGSFVYCKKPLVIHRLHEGAESSAALQDGTRRHEDYLMFKEFWPSPIARALTAVYTKKEAGKS